MLSLITSPLSIFFFAAFGHLVTVRAADCFDTTCVSPASWDDTWNGRQSFCGNSQPWKTDTCFEYSDGSEEVTFKISNPGANTEQNCWDAYQDIIDQCCGNSGLSGGVYNYNGVQYTLTMCGGC
ncbi:hypothetical protein CALVIDRAFT_188560 [Calocera viscosa TUFC12733]|uniref:Uncharacterized protein n=1 Tax=Calocera viscosa (strain TUFC12733) TaxID=1330018 RepID=A0A167KVT6_CALVF|nr:hypothetical protein CALVIDRAFT_188560 [Calocera viscosa TUFC12733]